MIVLDKRTPTSCDLQNSSTVAECWEELDTKFGDRMNVTATWMLDFMSFKQKAISEESKMVKLKCLVMKVDSDLMKLTSRMLDLTILVITQNRGLHCREREK